MASKPTLEHRLIQKKINLALVVDHLQRMHRGLTVVYIFGWLDRSPNNDLLRDINFGR